MKRLSPLVISSLLLPVHAKASDINEVLITSSPFAKPADLVGQPVNVLSGQALRDKAASTLGETLSGETGISSASFGPGVGVPVIRGQSGNRVKVMKDNLGTLDAANASPDHANGVEALLAERIEVLRGPATLRFGSGAIGGIVNVIDNRIPSKTSDKASGAFEFRHDTVNDGDTLLFKLDGSIGNVAWHLDGLNRKSNDVEISGLALQEHEEEEHEEEEGEEHEEEETTDGFIANTDTEATNLTGGFSFITDKGFWGLSVSRLENEYGIPPGAHGHHEEEEGEEHEEEEEEIIRIDMEQTRIDVKGEHALSSGFFNKFTFRAGYNDYEHIELEGEESGTVYSNEGWEGLAEVTHSHSDEWRGVTGLQWQINEFAAVGEESFIPESDISKIGLFIVEEFTLDNLVLEAGARIEEQRIDPTDVPVDPLCSTVDYSSEVDHQPFSLSGSAVWHATEQHHLSVSATHAQRAPSVEELFSCGAHPATGTFDVGNSSLDEETSLNFDIGYEFHGEALSFAMQFFYNSFDDYIYQLSRDIEDPESELEIFDYVQEAATFTGVEAEVEAQLSDSFSVRVFGDTVRATLDDGGPNGNDDIPRITPERVGLSGSFVQDNWDVALTVTEVMDQDRPGDGEEATEGYTNLSARINYKLPVATGEWIIFVRGDNLLDEEIRNATSFLREFAPEPGLNITLGTQITF